MSARVNIDKYYTCISSHAFNLTKKIIILQKPLFYCVSTVTIVSQFICVNTGVNPMFISKKFICFCHSVEKKKCSKTIKGRNTRYCLDTRQEAWMQDRKNTRKKTKGEMRRNLQLIACVRINHRVKFWLQWENKWVNNRDHYVFINMIK